VGVEVGVGYECGRGNVAGGGCVVICLVFVGGGDWVEPWEGAGADGKICDGWLEREGGREGGRERLAGT